MNLHFCLISDQLLANYIPVMMDKPDQVHLVSSAYMLKKGMTVRFRRMLEQQGIHVVQHDGMPDNDMAGIRDFAGQLWDVVNAQVPGAVITLNITGGNKLMTLGMWEVFNGVVERIIYTDTQHGRIEGLHDQSHQALQSVLTIPHYLQAYGVKFLNAASDDSAWLAGVHGRKAVSYFLAERAPQLEPFIGMMNYLANAALSRDGSVLDYPVQSMRQQPLGLWRNALLMLQKYGLLSWDGHRDITFVDADCTRYLGGIWLEEYVYLSACSAGPEHVACSVRVNWDSSRNATNELDVVVVHNNRMLVVECKTLRFGNDQQKDSDLVYKISDLGDDLRGLFGSTWLVSARQPTPRLLERARSRRLMVLASSDLKTIGQQLIAWMAG